MTVPKWAGSVREDKTAVHPVARVRLRRRSTKESRKTMNPEVERFPMSDALVVDPLLAMAREIPAGRVAEVWQCRPDAGHVDRVFIDELDLVVLLGDGVVTVHRDGAEWLAALRDVKAQ